jgi:hypothetical protein
MSQARRWAKAGVAVVAAGAVGLAGTPASAATGWTVEPVDAAVAVDMSLAAVSAASATDFYAVGWQRSRTPNAWPKVDVRRRDKWGNWHRELVAGEWTGRLGGVVALPAGEGWAVGSTTVGAGETPLALHMTADRGGWYRTATPPVSGGGRFNAVAATSAGDVWAVGSRQGHYGPLPLIERWNGTAWSVVTGQPESTATVLNGVAARAADDVWAVGARGRLPLVRHWDGHSWTTVPVPGRGAVDSSLRAVAVVSASDVWAVGANGLIEHYDGSAWQIVSLSRLPEPLAVSTLTGVAARGPADVWVVGTTSADRAVTLHWDGYRWASVPGPDPGTTSNALAGVAAPVGGFTVVVGAQVSDGKVGGLAARR